MKTNASHSTYSVRASGPVGFLAAVIISFAVPLVAHADATYSIRQTFEVKDLPPGAEEVRGWFWMPEDSPEQRVLDFRIVDAPPSARVTRDPRYGSHWLYAEAKADPAKPLRVVTEFTVLRKSVSGLADPERTSPIPAEYRRTFAAELRRDEKHMEVTPLIQQIADQLAGKERNPVILAHRFFDYVIDKTDHYSKFGSTPKGLCLGDATLCLEGTGDCCTDQHALFIALCRAKGIPCRLFYGSRINPTKEGKDYDPGYRCWPKFFAPGLGWIPLDVSAGDTAGDHASDWFGGLDDWRVEWAEGRDFDLEPRSEVRPDLVIPGWVEVDGKPHKGIVRLLNYQRHESSANDEVAVNSNSGL